MKINGVMEWRSQEYTINLAVAWYRQCKNTSKVNSWSNNNCQFCLVLLFLTFQTRQLIQIPEIFPFFYSLPDFHLSFSSTVRKRSWGFVELGWLWFFFISALTLTFLIFCNSCPENTATASITLKGYGINLC